MGSKGIVVDSCLSSTSGGLEMCQTSPSLRYLGSLSPIELCEVPKGYTMIISLISSANVKACYFYRVVTSVTDIFLNDRMDSNSLLLSLNTSRVFYFSIISIVCIIGGIGVGLYTCS